MPLPCWRLRQPGICAVSDPSVGDSGAAAASVAARRHPPLTPQSPAPWPWPRPDLQPGAGARKDAIDLAHGKLLQDEHIQRDGGAGRTPCADVTSQQMTAKGALKTAKQRQHCAISGRCIGCLRDKKIDVICDTRHPAAQATSGLSVHTYTSHTSRGSDTHAGCYTRRSSPRPCARAHASIRRRGGRRRAAGEGRVQGAEDDRRRHHERKGHGLGHGLSRPPNAGKVTYCVPVYLYMAMPMGQRRAKGARQRGRGYEDRLANRRARRLEHRLNSRGAVLAGLEALRHSLIMAQSHLRGVGAG